MTREKGIKAAIGRFEEKKQRPGQRKAWGKRGKRISSMPGRPGRPLDDRQGSGGLIMGGQVVDGAAPRYGQEESDPGGVPSRRLTSLNLIPTIRSDLIKKLKNKKGGVHHGRKTRSGTEKGSER